MLFTDFLKTKKKMWNFTKITDEQKKQLEDFQK